MVRFLQYNEINKFISFGDKLNKKDKNYVPFIKKDLKKTLKILVFKKKTYKALISLSDKNRINGRILLTVSKNKQLNTDKCGYFSHLEVVNDQQVFNSLMEKAISTLKEMGAEYILGSFFPFDPDNRRGILISGFELFPMIFTSHNPPYYKTLFENANFEKLTDALEYEYKEDKEKLNRIKEIAQTAITENDIHISNLNYNNLDKDIEDVHKIMEIASTKINFEHVLSTAEIKKIFYSWKRFINPDYALIARKNSDNSPVGFTLAIPNYFEIFKKINGKLNIRGLLIYLFNKNKIKGLRAILQYIIPEYQHKGVSKALYYKTKLAVDKNKVSRISLGTIMEENINSNGAIISLGGELSRVYRIYYKKII